jgi:hypothetical protein
MSFLPDAYWIAAVLLPKKKTSTKLLGLRGTVLVM